MCVNFVRATNAANHHAMQEQSGFDKLRERIDVDGGTFRVG